MGQLCSVPLDTIRENPKALRPVNKEDENYQGLVDSIRNKGFMGAITVTEKTDSDTGETYLELCDGLHRFNAAKDAGLQEINVDIVDLDALGVLEAQLMANAHKIETKPAQYSQQLKRILGMNPLMTKAELAAKLGKSPAWIEQRLSLNKIQNARVSELIDEGKITLSNAYALVRIPEEEWDDWLDRAMTLAPDEFIAQAAERAKEIKDARRQGKDEAPPEFTPVAVARKAKELKDELASGEAAKVVVAEAGVTTAIEGFTLGIQYALQLDPISVAMQKAKFDERQAEKAAAKERREKERAEKKAAAKKAEAEAAAEEAAALAD